MVVLRVALCPSEERDALFGKGEQGSRFCLEEGTMRIQYISRLTATAATALRPVAPILVVAGGSVPTDVARWDHVISVPQEGHRVAVDAGGLRFLTMPFEPSPAGRQADFEWLLRELEIARTDTVPVVCVTRGTPGFFLIAGTSREPAVLPHVRALLREPLRAWIVGETPTAMTISWGVKEGLARRVCGGSNPFGVAGFCSEIFMDVSTDAVRDMPVLQQLAGGQDYRTLRLK